MLERLLSVMFSMFFISAVAFNGSGQFWFYELGVVRTHWLNPTDFSSFLAFGFATPGPQVYGLATFIGYHEAGVAGALLATIAICTIPCSLAIVVSRYFQKWLQSESIDHFILGVGVAAAGLLVAAGFKLLRSQPTSIYYLVIALGACVLNSKRRVKTIWIIIVSGLLGVLIR